MFTGAIRVFAGLLQRVPEKVICACCEGRERVKLPYIESVVRASF